MWAMALFPIHAQLGARRQVQVKRVEGNGEEAEAAPGVAEAPGAEGIKVGQLPAVQDGGNPEAARAAHKDSVADSGVVFQQADEDGYGVVFGSGSRQKQALGRG
jgi:hypothetical protein